MSQEAIMVAVDNSDYMYNGDYTPSRHQAQVDAFNYFCNAKKRMNVENTCGLVTLANNQVVCTLTTDMSKLHSKITLVELCGKINFCITVRVSQLALRHRQSRNQKPRIVVFVGSPLIDDSEEDLVKLGKKLKKEKVSIDIISFGETEDNQLKLSNFIDTVNGKDNNGGSHLVTIPPGANLQDSLRTSPILMTEDGGMGLGGAAGSGFGMEEIDDPDLLYALRVSMEDQRMQQERAVGGTGEDVPVTQVAPSGGDTSEEDMLREAMAASLGGGGVASTVETSRNEEMVDLSAMSEEEQIAYAMRMSLQEEAAATGGSHGDTAGVTEMEVVQEADEKFDVVDNPNLIDDVLEQMDEDKADDKSNTPDEQH